MGEQEVGGHLDMRTSQGQRGHEYVGCCCISDNSDGNARDHKEMVGIFDVRRQNGQ